MEINAGAIEAGVAVITLVGGLAVAWVQNNISSVKNGQRILFEKHDHLNDELQKYKLHVAETYINRAALKELLLPIERRLETIEEDIRDNHARDRT